MTILILAFFTVAFAEAELVGISGGVVPSLLIHILLVVVQLNLYVLVPHVPYRRLLPTLAVASLLRICSIVIPIQEVQPLYWYILIGIPFLVAIGLTARLLTVSRVQLGLGLGFPKRQWLAQVFIALWGIPLSLAGYLILRPQPLFEAQNGFQLVIGMIILTIFTGIAEELYFRGLLLRIATELFGPAGVLVSGALFAILYIDTESWSYILFVGLVGLLLGWFAYRTGSIWGTIICHSIISIGMLLLWPVLAR